jgi:uncharacterized membrane protein
MATWIEQQRRGLRRRGRVEAAPILGALGIGAGLMYFLDPARGARRRALARDRIVHELHALDRIVEKGARDLTCRARGLVAEARSFFQDDDVPDAVLKARVRSRLGHVVGHPHAIDVTVYRGRVELRGAILADDFDGLVSTVAVVPGARGVDSRLDVYEAPDAVPALQGGNGHENEHARRLRERWSPLLRLGAGAVAVGLLAVGARRRDRLGGLLRISGMAILARDVADQSLRRMLGIGAERDVVEIHKTLTVRAPIEDVFDLWLHCERFPVFMDHLRRVEPLGEGRYRWIARGPLGLSVTWDADVTEVVLNHRIAWVSLPGSAVPNEGVVQLDETPDSATRITIQLAYNPPGGVLGHALALLFAADPKRAMDEDLVRLQSLFERGKTTAHGHEVRYAEVCAADEN